ncbi:hypothetical protein [Anaerotignum sp.]|uniref:hypothetical protein n=1 Tax=Anaerotignum sp. TaxID=2039241 RepID=UPI0028A19008|nr:hypothetical protein [Anaerotignum sp.]
MFDFNTLIRDRSSLDVAQGASKAFYNDSDVNRVEQAIKELNATLCEAGYPVGAITKTNWSKTDFPTENEMQRFLYNIQLLQNRFYPSEAQTPASMKWISYVEANNIEQILLDVEGMRRKMLAAYKYCGTLDCGGDVL